MEVIDQCTEGRRTIGDKSHLTLQADGTFLRLRWLKVHLDEPDIRPDHNSISLLPLTLGSWVRPEMSHSLTSAGTSINVSLAASGTAR